MATAQKVSKRLSTQEMRTTKYVQRSKWVWPAGMRTADDRMAFIKDLEESEVLLLLIKDAQLSTRVFAWLRIGEVGVRSFDEVRVALRAEKSPGATAAKNKWIDMRITGTDGEVSDALVDLLICADADDYAAMGVRRGAPFTRKHLMRFIDSELRRTAWEIANLEQLNAALLEALASAPSVSERIAPLSAAWEEMHDDRGKPGVFISDDDTFVARHPQVLVAMHPLTPSHVLIKLQKARSRYVRAAVASRQDLSQPVFRSLATDADALVRTAVYENPRADQESRALSVLLGIGDDDATRRALAAVVPGKAASAKRGPRKAPKPGKVMAKRRAKKIAKRGKASVSGQVRDSSATSGAKKATKKVTKRVSTSPGKKQTKRA